MTFNVRDLRRLKLGIADIIISIDSNSSFPIIGVDNSHKSFVISEGEPDMALHVNYGHIPDCELGKLVFDSGGTWSIYQSHGKYILCLRSHQKNNLPYKLAILEHDFKSGDIYIKHDEFAQSHYLYPLTYPLDELLMINLLSLGRGVLLHACGINDNGRGILFAGTSGAGKSTLANLWKGKNGVIILSDDRIIVRKIKDQILMYGTPWHGDAKMSSPRGVSLDKIFFIKHDNKNTFLSLKSIEAASNMLVRSFPTFWNPSGMQYTLRLISELAMKVPCYELGFVPDKNVLEFVEGVE